MGATRGWRGRVSAETYNDDEADRGMYWSYWQAPRGYGTCPDYPAGMYVANRDGMIRVAFLTDHAQVLVGSLPERRALPGFRADPLGALRAAVQGDSMLASFTGAAPSAKVRGFLPQRYFMRRAVGAGWVCSATRVSSKTT